MKKTVNISIGILMLIMHPQIFAEDTTALDCLVKPEMYIDISSPVGGILEAVLVKKTDTITKGQVLAQLNASVEQARVDVAQQEALMDNQVYAKIVKRAYAIRKAKRIAGLFKENASSAQEQDDAATEVIIAKTDLAQAKLDRTKNKLKLALAQAELKQKTILSAFDGIVVERYLMPGESVQNQPILQIAKIDPLLVEAVASAELFGKIKVGMTVKIKPNFPVNSTYKAKVSAVDRIIDAASGSFTIRLELPNPDDKLVGGTKCMAIFPIKTAQVKHSGSGSPDDALPEDIKTLLGQ
jgi:RND family efflux transporter MFP subunit